MNPWSQAPLFAAQHPHQRTNRATNQPAGPGNRRQIQRLMPPHPKIEVGPTVPDLKAVPHTTCRTAGDLRQRAAGATAVVPPVVDVSAGAATVSPGPLPGGQFPHEYCCCGDPACRCRNARPERARHPGSCPARHRGNNRCRLRRYDDEPRIHLVHRRSVCRGLDPWGR